MQDNNFVKFLKQKGFYISLITGVIAVFAICMISGAMLESNQGLDAQPDTGKISASVADNSNQTNELAQAEKEQASPEPTTETEQPTRETKDSNKQKTETDTRNDTAADTSEDALEETSGSITQDNADPETASVSSTQNGTSLTFEEEKGLLWPLEGDILMKYSMDSAVYFKTLAQYKCNPALLIAGDEGVPIYASADCVITDITSNEETGTTITASIGNDYELIYGNLKEGNLTVGDSFEEGQIIGYLDTPTKYYVEEGTNLFFEVLQDGTAQDPMLLLR